MTKDEAFAYVQEKLRNVTGFFGGFMDIHKVVTVYLWPFVFAGIVVVILIGVDVWRS